MNEFSPVLLAIPNFSTFIKRVVLHIERQPIQCQPNEIKQIKLKCFCDYIDSYLKMRTAPRHLLDIYAHTSDTPAHQMDEKKIACLHEKDKEGNNCFYFLTKFNYEIYFMKLVENYHMNFQLKNAEGTTALYKAIEYGHLRLASKLLKSTTEFRYCCEPNQTNPLWLLYQKHSQHPEAAALLQLLLEQGFSVENPGHYIVMYGKFRELQTLSSDPNYQTQIAATLASIEKLIDFSPQGLVDAGAKVRKLR